jgi:hypothetical protein
MDTLLIDVQTNMHKELKSYQFNASIHEDINCTN